MGLFTPYHGNYEVIYKANSVPDGWKKTQSLSIIVEADDSGDARSVAEKQLKSQGYKFLQIESVRLLKRTSGSQHSNSRASTKTSSSRQSNYSANNVQTIPINMLSDQDKKTLRWLLLIPAFLLLVFICAFGVYMIKKSNVEGTYYLKSIEGTVECSADSKQNYCVLEDGVCTLYFSLTQPQGSSIHTFYYTGNYKKTIKFDKDYISMDWDGCIVITFNYGTGQYNVFTYQKKIS